MKVRIGCLFYAQSITAVPFLSITIIHHIIYLFTCHPRVLTTELAHPNLFPHPHAPEAPNADASVRVIPTLLAHISYQKYLNKRLHIILAFMETLPTRLWKCENKKRKKVLLRNWPTYV